MKKLLKKIYEHFAFNALASENYEKSKKYFKKVLKLFPLEKGVNYNYAVSLIGSGDYNSAEIFMMRELKNSGEKFEILRTLAEICYLNNRREKAQSFFKKAINKCADTKESSVLKKKLSITADKNKYELMLKGYSLYKEGTVFLQNKDWQKAQALFLEATKFDMDNPFIYNNLGCISMMHKKNYEEAKGYFNKALLYSDLPSIKYNLQKAAAFEKNE